MALWLWVMLGGALGAACRFGLSTTIQLKLGDGFPFGTLIVNLIGCIAIGFAAILLEPLLESRPALRITLMAGFLGGFTTFSSFGLETIELLRAGSYGDATTYVLISNILGVGLVGAGMWMGQMVRAGT